MDQRVLTLLGHASELGEVTAGAYGYLSSTVDNYLHGGDVSFDQLRAEFRELQCEVTFAIERIMKMHGYDQSDVVTVVNQTANDMGLTDDERGHVLSIAMDYTDVKRRYTKP